LFEISDPERVKRVEEKIARLRAPETIHGVRLPSGDYIGLRWHSSKVVEYWTSRDKFPNSKGNPDPASCPNCMEAYLKRKGVKK